MKNIEVEETDTPEHKVPGPTLDQVETAAYISDILLQLRNMAKAADLKFLVYFLEMAFQEAFSQSTRNTKDE